MDKIKIIREALEKLKPNIEMAHYPIGNAQTSFELLDKALQALAELELSQVKPSVTEVSELQAEIYKSALVAIRDVTNMYAVFEQNKMTDVKTLGLGMRNITDIINKVLTTKE